MDKIRLFVTRLNYQGRRVVDISVNEKKLDDIVRQTEQSFTDRRKGGSYGSILYGEWTKRDFLNFDRESEILTCPSYDTSGCWSIYGRVSPEADKIVWSDFSNPHLEEWKRVDLKFVFDKTQYEAELSNLPPLSSRYTPTSRRGKLFKINFPWKRKPKEHGT